MLKFKYQNFIFNNKLIAILLYNLLYFIFQIENLLNEAMLNALRDNRQMMEYKDIDTVINKIMVGWQPTEHQFSVDIIERICIHEMGHAIVGFLSKHHSKVSKVIINLSSPNSPGYTMFESSTSNIYTREALFEHLMILLAGRIAEEEFYDVSVTTGSINDFSEAFKIAEKMNNASGAECKAICTEAGMFALRERRIHVTQEDFDLAVAKVMKKDSDQNMSMTMLWK